MFRARTFGDNASLVVAGFLNVEGFDFEAHPTLLHLGGLWILLRGNLDGGLVICIRDMS